MKNKFRIPISLLCYIVAVFLFLTAQFSTVSQPLWSFDILVYNYPLRLLVHCIGIIFAIIGSVILKTNKKWQTVLKIVLTVCFIVFVVYFGFPNNSMA